MEELPRVEDAAERLDVVDDDMVDCRCCEVSVPVVFWLRGIQRDVAGRRRGLRVVTDFVQYPLPGWRCGCP